MREEIIEVEADSISIEVAVESISISIEVEWKFNRLKLNGSLIEVNRPCVDVNGGFPSPLDPPPRGWGVGVWAVAFLLEDSTAGSSVDA